MVVGGIITREENILSSQNNNNNNNNKVYFAQTDGKRQSKAPNAHNLMSTIQNTRQSPHSPSVTE